MAAVQRPRRLIVVAEPPKTATGNKQRSALRNTHRRALNPSTANIGRVGGNRSTT
jgi:acyl-coenzyme A synthetase/AMP-(fatty) acid ligase